MESQRVTHGWAVGKRAWAGGSQRLQVDCGWISPRTLGLILHSEPVLALPRVWDGGFASAESTGENAPVQGALAVRVRLAVRVPWKKIPSSDAHSWTVSSAAKKGNNAMHSYRQTRLHPLSFYHCVQGRAITCYWEFPMYSEVLEENNSCNLDLDWSHFNNDAYLTFYLLWTA